MRLALVRDVNDLIDPPTPRLSLRTWQSKRKPIKFLHQRLQEHDQMVEQLLQAQVGEREMAERMEHRDGRCSVPPRGCENRFRLVIALATAAQTVPTYYGAEEARLKTSDC
jgi:hypothetical protein